MAGGGTAADGGKTEGRRASPEEEQEVHSDGGASAAAGGYPARRPAAPRGADAAGLRVPAFTDAGQPSSSSFPIESSLHRRSRLRHGRTPLYGRPSEARQGARLGAPPRVVTVKLCLPCSRRLTVYFSEKAIHGFGRAQDRQLLLVVVMMLPATTFPRCWSWPPPQPTAAGSKHIRGGGDEGRKAGVLAWGGGVGGEPVAGGVVVDIIGDIHKRSGEELRWL